MDWRTAGTNGLLLVIGILTNIKEIAVAVVEYFKQLAWRSLLHKNRTYKPRILLIWHMNAF